MSIEIREYVKNKVFPKKEDYIFSNMAEFFERVPKLLPKIEGKWVIALDRITFENFRSIQDTYKDVPYIHLIMYIKKTTIYQIRENYPRIKIGESSNWEKFLYMVSTSKRTCDIKVAREIYRRLRGNLDKVRETLDKFDMLDTAPITMKEVRREILDVPDIYYPRDLIMTILVRKNRMIPRKGSKYSRYLYYKPALVRDEVLETFSNEITFYAIRKFLRVLFTNKMELLRGENVEYSDLLSLVSIYEISRLYIVFESSTPSQIYSITEMMIGGEINVNDFGQTFLTY